MSPQEQPKQSFREAIQGVIDEMKEKGINVRLEEPEGPNEPLRQALKTIPPYLVGNSEQEMDDKVRRANTEHIQKGGAWGEHMPSNSFWIADERTETEEARIQRMLDEEVKKGMDLFKDHSGWAADFEKWGDVLLGFSKSPKTKDAAGGDFSDKIAASKRFRQYQSAPGREANRPLLDFLKKVEGRLGWDKDQKQFFPKKGLRGTEKHRTLGWGLYLDTPKREEAFKKIFGDKGYMEKEERMGGGMPEEYGDVVLERAAEGKRKLAGRIFDKVAKAKKLTGRWKDVKEQWIKDIITDKFYIGYAKSSSNPLFKNAVEQILTTPDPKAKDYDAQVLKRYKAVMDVAEQHPKGGSEGWKNRSRDRRGLAPKEVLDLFRPGTLRHKAVKGKAAYQYEAKIGEKDTLTAFGKRHGVSVKELKEWNDIPDPDKVRAGTKFKIKVPAYKER